MKKLVILGAGGHGKVAADIAFLQNYTDVVFLDDNISKRECNSCKIVGSTCEYLRFSQCDFFVAIGNANARMEIQNKLEDSGLKVVSLIHPKAVISTSAHVQNGTVVMPGAVINADAHVGRGCIINTCASVDHECVIGEFSHVSVGAHLAGNVKTGPQVLIAAGATVINNVSICTGTIIAAGAVVVGDVLEQGTYMGIPAKRKINVNGSK